MPVILDLTTHLLSIGLDTRGNAQHWALRTMDAALTKTIDNWRNKFDTQEAWDEKCVTPAVLGWQDYLTHTGVTKRGLLMADVRRKHQQRFQDAYHKAQTNWTIAFKDDAEHFYVTMLRASEFYQEDVEFYLSLVGLGLRNYVGPIGMHVMAICGNQRILDHLARNTSVSVLNFPAPPIIPHQYRKAFARAIMAVLCREVYFQLTLNKPAPPNLKLDEVLGGYLGFDYAGTPTSYIHVEHTDGTWYLHTHIEGAPSAEPPEAADFHVPVPPLTTPIGRGLVVDDLFFYGTAHTFPIATARMRLNYFFAPGLFTLVYLRRSDTAPGLVDFRLNLGEVVTVDVLPEGVTWQVFLYVEGAPLTLPPISFTGNLWFTDTEGNESNHAFWSIAGHALTVQPFTVTRFMTFPWTVTTVLVDDWFAHATAGNYSLSVIHVELQNVVVGSGQIFLFLHRSDDAGEGISIEGQRYVIQNLPALPPGVTWQLTMVVLRPPEFGTPLYVLGDFWVEDSSGALSQHAAWRAIVFLVL